MPVGRAIALSWRKSSASASENCVEVALAEDTVFVRDSKQICSHVLAFTSSEWRSFLSGVRAGEFNPEYRQPAGGRG